jgi:lipoyl-dependent peroxiredoxin
MTTRSSKAAWEGDLKSGKGTMTVGKGAYTGPFSFASRFEEGAGTNPEELVAAAHAGCFSMAFSLTLANAGIVPKKIETRADVHLGTDPAGGARITKIELFTDVVAPGISQEKFQELAEVTKATCPISKLVKGGTDIVLKATLQG